MAACGDALAALRSLGGSSVLPDSVWAWLAADAFHHAWCWRCAQLHRRMAVARLWPFRRVRVPAAGRHLRALARIDAAGGAGPDGAWSDTLCTGAGAPFGPVGCASSPLSCRT